MREYSINMANLQQNEIEKIKKYINLRDIESLFDEVNEEDYYKPILVKSSFKGNYKYYERRGDREKKYQ